MRIVPILRAQRIQLGLLIALFATLSVGLFAVIRAQAQVINCRDVENLTVCQIDWQGIPMDVPGQFSIAGSGFTIAPKGQAPILEVRDFADRPAIFQSGDATTEATFGSRVRLIGAVHLIGDPNPEPLIMPLPPISHPDNSFSAGQLFVDPASMRIFSPPADAVPADKKHNIARNQLLEFPFLVRSGIGNLSDVVHDQVDFEFDLRDFAPDRNVFTAVVPVAGVEHLGSARVAIDGAGRLSDVLPDPNQPCRDIGNVQVCADHVGASSNPVGMVFEGNLKIGPKGQPPVVYVDDIEIDDELIAEFGREGAKNLAKARLVVVPESAIFALTGSLHMLADVHRSALLESTFRADENGDLEPIPGEFFIDPLNARIYTPTREEYPRFEQRNDGFFFYFIDRTALISFATPVFERIDAEIKLEQGILVAQVPLIVQLESLDEAKESDNHATTARFIVDRKGKLTSGLDTFSVDLAGLTADLKEITIDSAPSTNVKPTGFAIGVVEFSRAANPDLPNLDPDDPDMVFRINNVRYRDGEFAVEGSVPLRDWQLGSALKLTKQSLTIGIDQVTKQYTLGIASTLVFGGKDSVFQDNRTYPVKLLVTAKTVNGERKAVVEAALTDFRPDLELGPLHLRPQDVQLRFDAAENFYGLSASRLTLEWDTDAGGASGGGLGQFRLGVDRDGELIFDVGGGTIEFPEYRSKVFSGKLRGTIGAENNVVTATLDGKLNLLLKGNTSVAPTVQMVMRGGEGVGGICPVGQTCDTLKPFEMAISSFEMQIAGLKLGIANPQGTGDGGFAAERVALTLPAGIGGVGSEVRWLRVSGDGDISVAGGGFELKPISVGEVQFVGLRGFFSKEPQGGYEVKLAGTMPLPGMDPGARKLDAELTLRERSDGRFGLGGVLDFTARAGDGVPIFNTGMELVQIKGSFDLQEGGPKKFSVFLRASSYYRVGSLPLISATGDATLQFEPFMFTANAQLSLLVINVAEASIGIGAGQGFYGGPGFNASFEVDATVIHGKVSLRMGDVVFSNGKKKFVVNGEALLQVGLKKNQFGKFLPPKAITLSSVEFRGGTFRTRDGKEVAGVMGTVGCCFFFERTIFYNFANDDVGFVDTDDYTLIGAEQIRKLANLGVAGYNSATLSAGEAQLLGLNAHAPQATLQQETVPIQLDTTGGALFGISYPQGNPTLRLRLPDGTILTEGSVDNTNSTFIRSPKSAEDDAELAFILKQAQPGTYSLIIDNAPAQYEKVSYTVNNAPQLEAVGVSCGGPTLPDVSATCNGTANGTQATVTWRAADSDSPNATVRVSAAPLDAQGEANELALRTLAADLPLGQGSYTWNMAEAPSGSYKLIVSVDDGQHAPVRMINDTLITISDQRAPAPIDAAEISLRALPGGMMAYWPPSTAEDIAGYEIGVAADDASDFFYTRDIGLKDADLVEDEGDEPVIGAQIWGLEDDVFVAVAIRTYDSDGNRSAWSERVSAKPWPVAPDAWLPIPDSRASTRTTVEVAFATPLVPDKFAGMLELRDSKGNPVAGKLERLTNLDGDKVVGLRFIPAAPLSDGERYEVFVNGNNDGVSTIDGRMMPRDYTWSFIADARIDPLPTPEEPGAADMIYLPVVRR